MIALRRDWGSPTGNRACKVVSDHESNGKSAAVTSVRQDAHTRVRDEIIAELEQGARPWMNLDGQDRQATLELRS